MSLAGTCPDEYSQPSKKIKLEVIEGFVPVQIKEEPIEDTDPSFVRLIKLRAILEKEIDSELKTAKSDLAVIEERIYQARLNLTRIRQSVVSEYYRHSSKSTIQRPFHPAVRSTFAGKTPNKRGRPRYEDIYDDPKPGPSGISRVFKEEQDEDVNILDSEDEDSKSVSSSPLRNVKSNYTTHTDEELSQSNSISSEKVDGEVTDEVKEDSVKHVKVPRYIPPKAYGTPLAKLNEPRGNVSKVKVRFIIGNVSKWLGHEGIDATHKWTTYIKSPDLPDISQVLSKVNFFLHPSYKPNDVVRISSPPYKLTRRGWGEFPLKIQLHFSTEGDKPVDVVHNLKLDRSYSGMETFGAETLVDVWLHLSQENETSLSSKDESSKFENETDLENPEIERIKTENAENSDPNEKVSVSTHALDSGETNSDMKDQKHLEKEMNILDWLSPMDSSLIEEFTMNYLTKSSDEVLQNLTMDIPSSPLKVSKGLSDSMTDISKSSLLEALCSPDMNIFAGSSKSTPSQDLFTFDPFSSGLENATKDDGNKQNCNSSTSGSVMSKEISTAADSYDPTTCGPADDDVSEVISEVVIEDVVDTNCSDAAQAVNSNPCSEDEDTALTDVQMEVVLDSSEETPVAVSKNIPKSPASKPIILSSVSSQQVFTQLSPQKTLRQCNVKIVPQQQLAADGTYKGQLASKEVTVVSSTHLVPVVSASSVFSSAQSPASNSLSLTNQKGKSSYRLVVPNNLPKKTLIISNVVNSPLKTGVIPKHVPVSASQNRYILLPGNKIALLNDKTEAIAKGPANSITNKPMGVFKVNYVALDRSSSDSSELSRKVVLQARGSPVNLKDIKGVSANGIQKTQIVMADHLHSKESKTKIINNAVDVSLVPKNKPKAKNVKVTKAQEKKGKKAIVSSQKMSHFSSPVRIMPLEKSVVPAGLVGLGPVIATKAIPSAGKSIVLKVTTSGGAISRNEFIKMGVASPASLNKSSGTGTLAATNNLRNTGNVPGSPTTQPEPAIEYTPPAVDYSSIGSVDSVLRRLCHDYPLVDSRVSQVEFKTTHPYCAPSRKAFLDWPLGKKRASEWFRSRVIVGIIKSKCPSLKCPSIIDVVRWSRMHGFSPCLPPKVLSVKEFEVNMNFKPPDISDIIQKSHEMNSSEIVNVVDSDASKSDISKTTDDIDDNLEEEKMFADVIGESAWVRKVIPKDITPSACIALSSAFTSLTDDILRKSLHQSWIRHFLKCPLDVEKEDVQNALVSREEFDIFIEDEGS